MRTRHAWGAVGLAAWMVSSGGSVFRAAAPIGGLAPDAFRKIAPELLQAIDARGESSFWVVLDERPDLTPAARIHDWAARGKFVVHALRDTAERSQRPLLSLLAARGAKHESFWIVNAIRVRARGDVLASLASEPAVRTLLADRAEALERTEESPVAQFSPSVIEWNVDRIRAPLVWSTYGNRGEGIVVANIDSGVQFTHPALVGQYRGNLGGGTFDHNYNWFDPSSVCGSPSLVPCDNINHGTHTMGIMVGDDGVANQIGVAPGARWIAAKGCESSFCSVGALLASGQWILAPTDLSGANPRPDLRPHVVDVPWSGAGGNPWYQAIVNAWVAAGIFPAAIAGNTGPGCGTAGSPGDYVNTYAAGAFDINNAIAAFSSRGPSFFGGERKPNIAAPGVAVRSSIAGSGYSAFSGTSMASAHVAGTVALLWSIAPGKIGDIVATRQALDDSAIDVANLVCAGTADDNNVWGEGRLDAYAAAVAVYCLTDAQCDDGEVCTDDACNASNVCTHTPNADPCDDGAFCNGADRCGGGTCSVHPGDPCDGGAECNDDVCDEVADDCFSPVGDPCGSLADTTCTDPDTCDGAGHCIGNHAPDGTPCNDSSPCTTADACSSGGCAGTPTTVPVVTITQPAGDQTGLPSLSYPIRITFTSSGPVPIQREIVRLDTCAIFDGATFGDRDGFLSDEILQIDKYRLCQFMTACGFQILYYPRIRVEATDTCGSTGGASRIIRKHVTRTEACAR